MSRKTLIALAAVAIVGAAAFAPSSASARGGGGGGGGGHAMSFHGGSHSTFSRAPVRGISRVQSFHKTVGRTPRGPHDKGRHFAKLHHERHEHHRHDHHKHFAHHYPWWWCHHHHHHHHHHGCGFWFGYPEVAEVEVTTPIAAEVAEVPTATPVARDNCTCLTKTYLPDGAVLFKDVCTKEMAMATADEVKAQAETPPAPK
jgi:hypothetical protein